MPSVEWSRVNQTDPSPYDQVFILSEKVINEAFDAMFPTPVPFSRQDKEAVRTRRTGQWIANAHVGAPRISIHVEERNPAYLVLFTLSFDSGRIHLRTSPPGAPSTFGNFPLAGWKLVFKTRIASKVLNSSDSKYSIYQSSAGFRDSVFELAQLYLDTSDVGAGAGFDPSKSSYSGTTLPYDTLDNLKLFVNEWLTSADERQLNVIGYSLTRQQPTSPHNWVGTFAPAVIDYAPYPWLDPRRPTVETDGLPQNALGILTYTDRSRRRGYGGLSHSGAFTNGGAAFCMNRDLFWNHYLLPILNEINQKTEVIPQEQRQGPNPYTFNLQVKYILGKNPKHAQARDRYFSWKQQTRDGQPHWSWKGDKQKAVSFKPYGAWRCVQEAQSSTDLTFAVGGQDIHIKGTVVYDIQMSTKDIKRLFSFHSQTEWGLRLRLEAVRSGGLQVHADQPTVGAKTAKYTPKLSAYSKSMQAAIRNYEQNIIKNLRSKLAPISKQLASGLVNLHKLFLPGGGVFRFGTPLFNKRGDLLADLEYLNPRAPTGRFTVNRVHRDAYNGSEDTAIPQEDLFEHISLVSEEYPEDETVYDHDIQVDDEDDNEEDPATLFDLEDHDLEGESDDDYEWPGPGEGPLAGVDWERIERTERPWHEEGDDDYPSDEYPPEPKKPEKQTEKPKEKPKEKPQPKEEIPAEDDLDDGPPPLGSGPLDG
ncbi:hypothetical protein BDW71DRAFT_173287 [Aspergillus fruticulosus]